MTGQVVRVEQASHVRRLVLDCPANRNALSVALREQLLASVVSAGQDSRVRVIHLTHDGPAFCSGADLKEVGRASNTAPPLSEVLGAIRGSRLPVVASVTGTARAGGLGLLAACDMVVADERVEFAFSEVRLGLVPAVISRELASVCRMRDLGELLLTGLPFTAARGQAMGLITTVVTRDELPGRVEELLAAFAGVGPGAVAETKRLLSSCRDALHGLDASELERISARHFGSEEGREGVAAFRDRRRPLWASQT